MEPDKQQRKPVPRPSPESIAFWEGAKAHRLMLPRCNQCGRFWFPPSQRCRHCLAANFAWVQASGTGRIYSFVVYHRVYHPGFADAVPYVVAIVELDEGPRLITNIVGMASEAVRCELRVRVTFEERDGMTLPMFSLA
jgi:uncharacterized OB-fold protein